MKNTYITSPSLPDFNEFVNDLKIVWNSGTLTNNGPFNQKFEDALAAYAGVNHAITYSNATLGLYACLGLVGKKSGHVITSPYSFVATTSVITRNNLQPFFVDVQLPNGNLDPFACRDILKKNQDENKNVISAIMPVHVYGIPCNVEEFSKISSEFNIPVIYDAAHCFGGSYDSNFYGSGSCSVVSFHATKVLNTFEGGAIFTNDESLANKLRLFKNFGFISEVEVLTDGLNCKMNEFSACLGLNQLKNVGNYVAGRREVAALYSSNLEGNVYVDNLINSVVEKDNNFICNYGYFPVLIKSKGELSRDGLYNFLRQNNIFARRYFYPLISELSPFKSFTDTKYLKKANIIADSILCLPIYPHLDRKKITECTILINQYFGG